MPAGAIEPIHRQALMLRLKGLTQAEVAQHLGVSERAVRNDIARLRHLFGVKGELALKQTFEQFEAAQRIDRPA
ncbi:sigma factor-like helix-turn-helix DNA-binding protein [Kitasatospora sp. NPDC056531]|uniref:sigma factor-like helix-turn-helix DNA-binding protein n=1 Tax=Kitasatospora sp. NPDC056531 TaxID=3345856 RepID=UPI0036C94D60